jgi:hypothetical protein
VARLFVALIACLLLLPRLASAQADSAQADRLVGYPPLRFRVPGYMLREPAALRAPWLGAARGAARMAQLDSALATALDSARAAAALARRSAVIYGTPARPVGPSLVDTSGAEPVVARRGLFGLSEKYADLTLEGVARLDIRTERQRNERCTPAEIFEPNSGCRGGIKPPRLENTMSVRSSGLIGRRVHVNIDYDTERDFSANNNIQVFYQGLEDEVVRRVEVGSVTFRPPPSRFLAAAIPRSNFGVNAQFEVGPVQFQGLAATQKGSALAERVFTVGGLETSSPQDRQLRDLDFESGRFFWVVDPQRLPAYPAVDILNLDPTQISLADRPSQVRVYRYQVTVGANDPNLGGIRAFARNHADPTQFIGADAADEGVQWELLVQGRDYYLDPSGLWVALTSKLGQNDYLAVSYTTSGGGTVGSFPAADRPAEIDSLELIVQPRADAARATFRHEMRQVYRVAGTDLDAASLQVALTLNRSERPASGAATYLAQLGLALPADAGTFDRENRLFPRARDAGSEETIRESYIVFPHLTPFGDDARLTPGEQTDSLYRTPLYLLLTQGPSSRFEFRLRYNARGGGDRSTLNLNAIQVKDGSEQIEVGGRALARNTDYTIDYGTGLVTFIDPDRLFGASTAQVVARFEQQDVFAVAPTSILGFTSTYSLGERGAINLVGVYQREATAYNRPQLGFEAKANLVGGINTELHFRPSWLTRALNSLTSSPAIAPSLFDVDAELAFSRPDPNRSGAAYLEEFETEVGTPVSLREQVWQFGSRPQRTDGVESLGFGTSFDLDDAVQLTWQNLIPVVGQGGPVQIRPQDIDTTFRFGSRGDQFETVMYVTLHGDTAGGFVLNDLRSRWTLPDRALRPRWRSMVTPLSTTGLDLSRSEYLEFWVYQAGARSADSAGLRLVVDLGTVSEDAVALAPQQVVTAGADSLFSGRQVVGLGRLDGERRPDGIFNAATDDVGILSDRPDVVEFDGVPVELPQLCTRALGSSVPVYPWGDLSARCTNGNGTLDTEDLNNDRLLDATGANEDVFRYVVELASDQYRVAGRGVKTLDASGREAGWSLYRVPLRALDAISLGSPNLRLVKHLRLTLATPPDDGGADVTARFAFARMRFVGAPWVRRTETPVAGIAGAIAEPDGEVLTSIVSTENVELGYTSPPGVVGATNVRDAGQNELPLQINEKSLRVIGRGLASGERAEAYLRFPSGPQNTLNYRELRVWARGRGEGWERGDLRAFVKLGSDNENFYLYSAPALTTSWEPEMVIDLEVWRRLRGELETRWLTGQPPSGAAECGGNADAYVACDGAYLVHLASPGINPPNLAAVQEISAGILRVADLGALPEAELWVDDIRLARAISETGKAMALDARLVASDVGDMNLSFLRQDGQFRQLGQLPTYRTNNTLRAGGSWRLDRFLPASLGLAIPATVSYTRTSVDPQLISGTDLRGATLEGLRRPEGWTTTYALSLRRTARGTHWLTQGFLDPLALNATMTRGRARTELSEARSENSNYSASYNLQLKPQGISLSLGGLLDRLPAFLRETEGGKALRQARISLVPSNVRLSSGLSRDRGDFTSYQVPVARESDALLVPTTSLNHLWRNLAGLTWQPLGMLTLSADLASTRDLRVYPDSTPTARLTNLSRRSFLGIDAGVERDRNLSTTLSLAPRLTSWLRPRLTTQSSFVLSRSLTTRAPVRLGDDTLGAFILPQTLNNSRSRELGASFDLARLTRGIAGDSSWLGTALARVRPLDVSHRIARNSTFDLAAFEPSLNYQLAFGGLDNFLSQEGGAAPARGASEIRTRSVATGADLPFGLSATVSFSNSETVRFQRVGEVFIETQTDTREWPRGSLRWSRTFRGGPLVLVALGATVARREGTSTQPSVASGTTTSSLSSSSFAPDVQVTFRNGLGANFRLNSVDTRNENNGNSTVVDQGNLGATLTYSFRLPASISRTRKLVRSSVQARSDRTLSCFEGVSTGGECTVVSDTRLKEISGGFQTDVNEILVGGIDFGYSVSEARHLDRKASTLFMNISFQLLLNAGDFR